MYNGERIRGGRGKGEGLQLSFETRDENLTRGRGGAASGHWRAAEFFAGVGLVRLALEQHGVSVIFANDIEPAKRAIYAANFDASDFVLGDVRNIVGGDIPEIDLATASFPCTDLSLAGNRAGLRGAESSMFYEFARVLREMRGRRPRAVLLENVVGFATSHNGADLASAVGELNSLGYICDIFALDARRFVPQSRPRMFIVGSLERLTSPNDWGPSELRPEWVRRFVESHPKLKTQAMPLSLGPTAVSTLSDVVERLRPTDPRWWESERVRRFVSSLSAVQTDRLARLASARRRSWATAYRRTRRGEAVWEIRGDEISGCLRTARGGSSKQALVQAGRGAVRVRWMTPVEYARLQGAPDFDASTVSENRALSGLGDAVCVPVVSWITRNYLDPLVAGELTARSRPKRVLANA